MASAIESEINTIEKEANGEKVRRAIISAAKKAKTLRELDLRTLIVLENNKTYKNGKWNAIIVNAKVDGDPKLGPKDISANGEYEASDDNLDGYNVVNVNVGGAASPVAYASQVYVRNTDTVSGDQPHETQEVSQGKGCTFSAIPAYPSNCPDFIYLPSGNPTVINGGEMFSYVKRPIKRIQRVYDGNGWDYYDGVNAEITDSWATIAAHPENYDIGQYKKIRITQDDMPTWYWKDYDGNDTAITNLGFPGDLYIFKVGEYEKPLGFHNGYAKTVWMAETLFQFGSIMSINKPGFYGGSGTSQDYYGYGWGEIPNPNSPNYSGSRGLREDLDHYYRLQLFDIINGINSQDTGVLKEAIVPVINKSSYVSDKGGFDDTETIDRIWIPNYEENQRYLRILRGANDENNMNLSRFYNRKQGSTVYSSYMAYPLRDMSIDDFYCGNVLSDIDGTRTAARSYHYEFINVGQEYDTHTKNLNWRTNSGGSYEVVPTDAPNKNCMPCICFCL